MCSHRRALAFVLVFLAISSLPGAAPPSPEARVDPLPGGALARFGTARYRAEGVIAAVVLSPDGRSLFVADGRGICVLDVATGKELRRFPGPKGRLRSLVLSADGKALAGCDLSGARLWDAVTGRDLLKAEEGRGGSLGSPAFSGDGKWLVVGGGARRRDPSVPVGPTGPLPLGTTVYEVATGHLKTALDVADDQTDFALSPDGKVLATWAGPAARTGFGATGKGAKGAGKGGAKGGAKGARRVDGPRTIRLQDVLTGKEKRKVSPDVSGVQAVAFSPDGKHMAVAGGPRVAIHEVESGKQVDLLAARQGSGALLAYSPDGKVLAVCTADGAVQLWQTATGKRLVVRDCPAVPVLGPSSPPPSRLRPPTLVGPSPSVCFAPDGRVLAASVRGQSVCVWDVRTGRAISPLGGHTAAVTALAFAADGKSLLSADGERLCVWDLPDGKETRSLTLKGDALRLRSANALLSPDGRHLVTGGTGGLRLLETATGGEVFELAGGGDGLHAAFSRDGCSLAVIESEGRVADETMVLRVWDISTGRGRTLHRFKGFTALALAFSPDGKHLVLAHSFSGDEEGPSGEMRLWAVADGKELWKVARAGSGGRIAFAPNGRYLAGVDDLQVRLWDRATGRELGCLEAAGQGAISALAFSPDGRVLAVARTDDVTGFGDVQLWEMASGGLRQAFRGHRGLVHALAFAPDGSALASAGADTAVLLWGLIAPGAGELGAADLDAAWRDLDSADAAVAYRAIRRLAAAPKSAIPFLGKRVAPAQREDARTIARLIGELDSEAFAVREQATLALARLGVEARSALEKALTARPSLERKARIKGLLARMSEVRAEAGLLRPLRALEALERMGSAEAMAVLAVLARGGASSALTQEAQAVLARQRAGLPAP